MALQPQNNPGSGIQSWTQIPSVSRDAFNLKTKQGAQMEIPGVFYNQWVPTPATVTSGTVTNNGQSLIGALQLGGGTATVLPLGGDSTLASITSSSGALCTVTTSTFMPTTLNYDQYPIVFTAATTGTNTLPSNLSFGTVYYAQWVSGTTFRLAATPNGTTIPYVSAIVGTIYVQSAMAVLGGQYGYYGSPWIPAGFFSASEGMTTNGFGQNSTFPGVSIHYEIQGHKIGTGTNTFAVTPGLVSAAGTWTAITAAGSALAAVSAGPFPFFISGDVIIQQYGQTAVNSPYTAIAMIRCSNLLSVYSAAGTHTEAINIWAKTVSLDVTQAWALDVRYLAGTPVVGEYLEPLMVRYTSMN
jgi:hypothetical protein